MPLLNFPAENRLAYLLEFELDGLPKTTNAGGRVHWTTQHSRSKIWKKKVLLAVLTKAPPIPLLKAKLTLIRCSSVCPDFDGLCSSFKSIIDGLILACILDDDKMTNIGQPIYLWEKAPKNKGKIKVKVEEI